MKNEKVKKSVCRGENKRVGGDKKSKLTCI